MEKLLSTRKSSLLASLVSQNMTLRLVLVVVGGLFVIQCIGLIVLGFRDPLVVGLDGVTPVVLENMSDADLRGPEVRAFILDLLNRRFPSRPNSENLILACKYFSEGLRAACENEVRTKKSFIPQDILVLELSWESNKNRVIVLAKRFVNLSGSISAIQSTIQIEIEKRSRTKVNPWGIFVRSWKEDISK